MTLSARRLLPFLLVLFPAVAAALSGTAERISDGDTMRIRSADGTRTTIRLAGIDAPEKDQPFGRASGRRLSAICLGKPVEAEVRATDRYGRTVARVRCDGEDVARTLLGDGLAWHYLKYARTQPADEARGDSEAEASARAEKRGLWADQEPVAPWTHRKERKAAKAL
jgi:endonuclease YncB( thermonuclease family)